MSPEETIEKFKALGLNEQKAKETLKNGNVTKSLLAALNEVRKLFMIYSVVTLLELIKCIVLGGSTKATSRSGHVNIPSGD